MKYKRHKSEVTNSNRELQIRMIASLINHRNYVEKLFINCFEEEH